MITAIAFALLLQAASVPDGTQLPVFDCEAQPGNFSSIELKGSESGFRMSGTIQPKDLQRGDGKWIPSFGILFVTDDGKGGAGVQFSQDTPTALTFGPKLLVAPEHAIPSNTVPLNEPIHLAVSLDSNRRLEFEVNGERYEVSDLAVGGSKPLLMCSGGHFTFENLVVATDLMDVPAVEVPKP